jgi:hypothetical protein
VVEPKNTASTNGSTPAALLPVRAALVLSILGTLTSGDDRATYAASSTTIRGVVQEDTLQRGLREPQKSHEWMSFLIQAASGRVVSVEMEREGPRGRTIEGSVFSGSEVVVSGHWRDGHAFRASLITDLRTGATIDGRSPALRYREGQRMSVEGDILDRQPKQLRESRWQLKEKWRFLLVPFASTGTARPISVEIVKSRIRGLLRDDEPVLVTGEWTDRNVLRADRIVMIRSGAVVE